MSWQESRQIFDDFYRRSVWTHFKHDTLLLSTNRSSLYSLLSSFLQYAFCKNKQTKNYNYCQYLAGSISCIWPPENPTRSGITWKDQIDKDHLNLPILQSNSTHLRRFSLETSGWAEVMASWTGPLNNEDFVKCKVKFGKGIKITLNSLS